MAEQSLQTPPPVTTVPRWRIRVSVAIASLTLAGTATPGGPPVPPALVPDRTRLVRSGVLAPSLVSVPIRALRRWIRLRLALPAIGVTPTSRSDTPALPTVGRPRDHPGVARLTARSLAGFPGEGSLPLSRGSESRFP